MPMCVAIATHIIVPKLQARIYGKANKAERTFNDLQAKQIVAAKKWGITPLSKREDVAKYSKQSTKEKKLVKISSNPLYFVRHLTHSVPYLVPKAEVLLADIATEIPVFYRITNARVHDVNSMDWLTYEPLACYVFDKGYFDLDRLISIEQSGAFFIIREKFRLAPKYQPYFK